MRRFESDYRINEGDDVLSKENAIHQDVDLRLDAIELLGKAFAEGNRLDVDLLLSAYQRRISELAARADNVIDVADAALIAVSAATSILTDKLYTLAIRNRRGSDDQDFVALPGDAYVCFTSLTAARTVRLPLAATFPVGQPLYVADESGDCSEALTITVAAAGSDTIASQASVTMGSPYQKLAFHSNGSNLWTFA